MCTSSHRIPASASTNQGTEKGDLMPHRGLVEGNVPLKMFLRGTPKDWTYSIVKVFFADTCTFACEWMAE